MLGNNFIVDEVTPSRVRLSQNYPNPFKENTTIKYFIAFKAKVRLTVYNSNGVEIKELVDKELEPGAYEVEFSALDIRHNPSLQNNIYRYRLEVSPIGLKSGHYSIEKKMILEK